MVQTIFHYFFLCLCLFVLKLLVPIRVFRGLNKRGGQRPLTPSNLRGGVA